MAEIFDRVIEGALKGAPVTYAAAMHRTTQRGLRSETIRLAGVAQGILDRDSEERTGTSFVTAERWSSNEDRYAHIDHFVVLNDERGARAAMTIEYGRNPDTTNRGGPSAGVAPLRKAIGRDIGRMRRIGPRRSNGSF